MFYHSPCMCKRQSKHLAKSEDGKGGGTGAFWYSHIQSQISEGLKIFQCNAKCVESTCARD